MFSLPWDLDDDETVADGIGILSAPDAIPVRGNNLATKTCSKF